MLAPLFNNPPMFKHQQAFHDFWLDNPRVLNFSDAGSGKTRATLEAINTRKIQGLAQRTLVLGPLSILQPAWGNDIDKWTPNLTYSVAYAKNRAQAFAEDTDIVITNHDAVKWLEQNPQVLVGFDTLVVDESTAFKNYKTAKRTKSIMKLAQAFKYRVILTGTPNPKSVVDLWSQVHIVDDGERLGKNFYHFQNQVQTPYQVTPTVRQWRDKPNAEEVVTAMLSDITFRVKLEDCIDMPENIVTDMSIDIPKKLRKQYEQFLEDSILELESGRVDAINAGVRFRKLQQMLTGCVYDSAGNVHKVHNERYELVRDLIMERNQCLVAFNFKHERTAMVELCKKEGIVYAVIDGETKDTQRSEIVDQFQAGNIKVIFAHPQSAGHGLTLTAATTTIWASPTYNAEHYEQFNRRFYRAGQTKRTETIRIAAADTIETSVYEKLEDKRIKLHNTLDLLKDLAESRAAA